MKKGHGAQKKGHGVMKKGHGAAPFYFSLDKTLDTNRKRKNNDPQNTTQKTKD